MSPVVVGLGEVLWDLLPTGPQLGGAPANFSFHAQALGAEAAMITRVGDDDWGRQILSRFAAVGLPTDVVQVDAAAPTGTVSVELSSAGVPSYTIHEPAAWDWLAVTDAALHLVRRADAVCFGSLGQRGSLSAATMSALLPAAPESALKIFDINLRQHFYSAEVVERSLRLANVLKLNDAELPVLAAMFGLRGDERSQLAALADRFELRVVAYTRGPQGSLLRQGERWSECRPEPVQVVDTVGAGDSFTAALTVGLLRGLDLDAVNQAANEVARYVCSCAGATPALPASLKGLLHGNSGRPGEG